MPTTADLAPRAPGARETNDPGTVRAAAFAAGTIAWMFAVGGRWDLPLAAWIYPVLLLRFSRGSSPRTAAMGAVAAAIAAAFVWAFESAVPLNLVTAAACAVFGLTYAIPFIVDRFMAPRLGLAGRLLLFPAARAACEFLLSTFSPQGASYGLAAMTQTENLALLQVTAVTGAYGIGFVICLAATTTNHVWESGRAGAPLRERARPLLAFAALLAALLLLGGARIAFAPPPKAYVRIAGIAPDLATLDAAHAALGRPVTAPAPSGADPRREQAVLGGIQQELFTDTRRAAAAGAQVVVWSENAAVLQRLDDPAFLAQVALVAREAGVWLNVADNVPLLRDETRLFDPSGRAVWLYRKAHPIPGLEAYAPGPRRPALTDTPFGRIANVICYDADFPPLMRIDADVMLVPGGDWREMGAVHTLKMARLRAIENGYALFRQDFNGMSAAFDAYGRTIAKQDTTVRGRLIFFADVPTEGSPTLYRAIGDVFAWLCVAVIAGLTVQALRSRHRLVRGA